MGNVLRARIVGAVLVAVAIAGLSAPTGADASTCHPGAHVLARRDAVVLWSQSARVGRRVRTRVFLCAPSSGGARLVTSGGNGLSPVIKRLEVAGHFVAFMLTTSTLYGMEQDTSLVVFDARRGRTELTDFSSCDGTRECALAPSTPITRYLLAPNGWVAELKVYEGGYGDTNATGYPFLVATSDGTHFYSVDYGTISALAVAGTALSWTSDLGGASSAQLGPDLIPSSSPQPLSACQAITAEDLMPVLGASTSAASPVSCTYTSTANPSMTLTVGVQPGLTPAQQSAYEQALTSAGWSVEQAGYSKSTASGGVTHRRLYAFENGVQLSLDLTIPGTSASEQLAWLSVVAFDRLLGVPVQRAL